MPWLRGLPEHPLGLHWPNDVYVGRGKLAGILVEVLPDGRHIIGIGLNSNSTAADAPPEIRESIATLADLTGRPHDHTELLVALLENLEAALVQLGEPVETLGERFDLLCLQRGEVLTVHQGEQKITGRCVGIAPDGALLLDTPEGRARNSQRNAEARKDGKRIAIACASTYRFRRHAHFLPVVVQLPAAHVAVAPQANAIEIRRNFSASFQSSSLSVRINPLICTSGCVTIASTVSSVYCGATLISAAR